jgi:hypothetical protein
MLTARKSEGVRKRTILEIIENYKLRMPPTVYYDLLADVREVEEEQEPIKALEQKPQTFKWCTDCREYDQEKHCCHRWSKVIRDTVEEMKQEYIEREVLDNRKSTS